jgi:hypothetical protein
MEALEEIQELITATLDASEMLAELKLNGIDAADFGHLAKNTIDMAVLIADGMVNGLAADCPECGSNSSLVTCHGKVWCWGYVEMVTKVRSRVRGDTPPAPAPAPTPGAPASPCLGTARRGNPAVAH